jgi:hypothetical protein
MLWIETVAVHWKADDAMLVPATNLSVLFPFHKGFLLFLLPMIKLDFKSQRQDSR